MIDQLKAWKSTSLEEEGEDDKDEEPGHEEEEEEEEEEEHDSLSNGEEGDGEEKRDYAKARKFKRLADKGAIPEHIMDLFNNVAKSKAQPRAFKTKLINQLFEKDGKGGYVIQPKKPMFESRKEVFHAQYGKDEQAGSPKIVFLHSVFHGNRDALEDAIQQGAVVEYLQDGVPYCSYRKTKAGVKKMKTDNMKIHDGARAITLDQHQALGKAWKSMAWTFDNGDGSSNALASSSNQKPKQKALETSGLTKPMKELLGEAKGAHEKLLASSMKMLGKCSDMEDKKNFKSTVLELKDWLQQNDHVLTWEVWLSDFLNLLFVRVCVTNAAWVSGTSQ